MKKIITITAITLATLTAKAQTNASATAQQTAQLSLSNALELTFTANNSTTGATVNIPFSTVEDYANGVESTTQQLKVRSNKTFNVTVKANATNFTVSNAGTSTTSTMPATVLGVKITNNSTGGQIASTYGSYTNLTSTATNMITNGSNGGNQNFTVQYKAAPGFTYPAGTYTLDVVYTATQQ